MDIFFPVTCLGCSRPGLYICQRCRSDTPIVPPTCFGCGKLSPNQKKSLSGRTCKQCQKKTSIYGFYSPYLFASHPVRELIAGLKYRRIRPIADILGQMVSEYLLVHAASFPENSLLIPIPLYHRRKRKRGFNQSEHIAKKLSKRMKIPVESKFLLKKAETSPQVGLAATKRRGNIVNSFTVAKSRDVRGKTAILVDDVKTTGATLEEAARVLKEAGVVRVYAVTVAH